MPWIRRPGIWPRRRKIALRQWDDGQARWLTANPQVSAPRSRLTISTYNVWFDAFFAGERYLAIAGLLAADPPDVMVFQEVTDSLLAVLLAQPWVRRDYTCAALTGRRVGTYGMLLLSRIPVCRATYTRVPTRARRGFLRAELSVGGQPLAVCCIHLDSGKRSAPLRVRQWQRIAAAVRDDPDAVVLGDFNMRDKENHLIAAPFVDVWPTLRPDDPGYTEDTSINAMRYDMRNKARFVRFDRILLKGSRWRAHDIELLGTQPISPAHPRVFPSDHFGVRCVLHSSSAVDESG